jgi:MFS family permease
MIRFENRFAILIVGIVLELFVTGVIYGFPSLARTFDKAGEFNHLCVGQQQSTNSTLVAADDIRSCVEKDIVMSSIFSAGTFSLLGSAVFHGMFLDRVGTRIARSCSYVVSLLGAVGFVFANDAYPISFILSFACLGCGGLGIHLSLLRLGAKLFPNARAMAIASLNGAFCASGYVFVLFLYSELSRQTLFIIYSGVLLLSLIVQLFLPSDDSQLTDNGTDDDCAANKDNNNNNDDETSSFESALSSNDTNDNNFDGHDNNSNDIVDLKSQLWSLEFWLYVGFVILNVVRLQFFIGTVSDRVRSLSDDRDTVTLYVLVANLMTPLGFLLTVVYGRALDHSLIVSAIAVNCLGIANYVVAAVPVLQLQLLGYALWAAWRGFLFAFIYSFVAKRFSLRYFGLLSGLTLTLAGVSSLLQIAMRAAVGDSNFVASSSINASIGIIGFILPFYLYFVDCRRQPESKSAQLSKKNQK